MRLVIFGATGRTGRRLVARALDDGHWVRAFVRGPNKAEEVGLPTRDKNLSLFEGGVRDAPAVRSSDLEWTLVRPPRMTTGPATRNYASGYLAPGPTASISRADVAAFMVEVLDEGHYIREAPMVVSV